MSIVVPVLTLQEVYEKGFRDGVVVFLMGLARELDTDPDADDLRRWIADRRATVEEHLG